MQLWGPDGGRGEDVEGDSKGRKGPEGNIDMLKEEETGEGKGEATKEQVWGYLKFR